MLSRPCRYVAFSFGTLGGRALLKTWSPEPADLDLLNAGASSGFFDGSGRWRMVMLKEDHRSHPHDHVDGRLYRTPTGAAVTVLRESVTDPVIIEYSPDGSFSGIVLFGSSEFASAVADSNRYPRDVVDAYRTAAADRWQSSSMRGRAAQQMREQLMPDDPAELWTHGPDLDATAQWWQTTAFRGERW